jgi:hypothetical protein
MSLAVGLFLCRQTALFMEEAVSLSLRKLLSNHNKIDLAALGCTVAMNQDEAEGVDLIRNTGWMQDC